MTLERQKDRRAHGLAPEIQMCVENANILLGHPLLLSSIYKRYRFQKKKNETFQFDQPFMSHRIDSFNLWSILGRGRTIPISMLRRQKKTLPLPRKFSFLPCFRDLLLLINEPRSEKTGLRGFRPGPIQTGLYSHRR